MTLYASHAVRRDVWWQLLVSITLCPWSRVAICARQLAIEQYSNLQSLCYACHAEIHKAEHSHMVSKHKERMQQRLERWKEIHTRVREVAAKNEDLDKQKQ